MERNSVMMQGANYKLIDLLKFICAFLVIGIHIRPLQAISNVADEIGARILLRLSWGSHYQSVRLMAL